MQPEIKRYPVSHPVLQKYIRFFWELHIENAELNHLFIAQRNINLRFNLSETPQYLSRGIYDQQLDDVFFSGIHDHFGNTSLKAGGKVAVLGVCFLSDGFFPFFNIPVSEFKNQVVGAGEAGLTSIKTLGERLKEAPGVAARLAILESELLLLLAGENSADRNFRRIFAALSRSEDSVQIARFCEQNNLGERQLERLFNKHVGVPANTFATLNRFHKSLNMLLSQNYLKLSDVAFDQGYFDQMHFIRDFKRFAGNTPKNFVRQNNSILQIGKMK